jgi:hypothetical protein
LTEEKAKLLEEYEVATEEKRKEMTKQFGARLFQVLQEELDTLNWFEQGGSKTCPRCDARIEVSSLLHG